MKLKIEKHVSLSIFLVILLINIFLPAFSITIIKNASIEELRNPVAQSSSTQILRPDDDYQNEWKPIGQTHWTRVDDNVEQPSAGNGVVIEADNTHLDKIEEFEMTEDITVKSISQIEIWTYGKYQGLTPPKVAIFWDGALTAYQDVNVPGIFAGPCNYGWASNIFTVSGSQCDLNNLRVSYKARPTGGIQTPPIPGYPGGMFIPLGRNYIDTCYVIVTFEPGFTLEEEDFDSETHGTTGLTIDFIDEYLGHDSGDECDQYINDGPFGNPAHSKVLFVRDYQNSKQTWSVHSLDNPLYAGSIEFSLWMGKDTSCTSPNYHYLSFRNSEDEVAIRFQFDLDENKIFYHPGSKWCYITTLQGDEWYRYHIDFDILKSGTFNLTIVREATQQKVMTITHAFYENTVVIEEVYIGTNVTQYGGNTRWDDFSFYDEHKFSEPISAVGIGDLGGTYYAGSLTDTIARDGRYFEWKTSYNDFINPSWHFWVRFDYPEIIANEIVALIDYNYDGVYVNVKYGDGSMEDGYTENGICTFSPNGKVVDYIEFQYSYQQGGHSICRFDQIIIDEMDYNIPSEDHNYPEDSGTLLGGVAHGVLTDSYWDDNTDFFIKAVTVDAGDDGVFGYVIVRFFVPEDTYDSIWLDIDYSFDDSNPTLIKDMKIWYPEHGLEFNSIILKGGNFYNVNRPSSELRYIQLEFRITLPPASDYIKIDSLIFFLN